MRISTLKTFLAVKTSIGFYVTFFGTSGAGLGSGGKAPDLLENPSRPKGYSFLRYPFLVFFSDLKILLAPIYTNLMKGTRAKKRSFCGLFFAKLARGAENLANTHFLVLWESSENQFDRHKKGRQYFEFFLKISPPPTKKF